MEKIRIIEIIRDASGGMKKHVEAILNNLNRDKFTVTIAGSKGQFDEEYLASLGVKFFELNIGDRQSSLTMFDSLIKLVKFLKRERINVIHAHGITCSAIATIAAILSGVEKVITTIHNVPVVETNKYKQRYKFALAGYLLNFNHNIIVVSNAIAIKVNALWKIPNEKIHIIYNGIDSSTFEKNSKDDSCEFSYFNNKSFQGQSTIILSIARLIEEKGLDTFIKAIYILTNELKEYTQTQDLVFVIAGDGPQEIKLKELVNKLGLQDRVVFLGYVENIYNLIMLSKIVVLSSRQEGFGISLLEALALKKAVVATNVGGIPEIIEHEKTGVLIPPNDPKSLADAILYLLNNPKQAEKIKKAGYEKVLSKFTIDKMIKDLEVLYNK